MIARILFGASCLLASSSRAQASAQEVTLASRLFDDATQLMAENRTAAACPKYAESERLDPQLGTLLHLAECFAKLNKTASAWTSFEEAADMAAQRGDPREAKIRERLSAAEKALCNVVIVVPEREPAELEIRQDGALLNKAAWNTPIPVDPGEHEITASAPGTRPRRVRVTVSAPGTLSVALPAVEALPSATTQSAANARSGPSSQRAAVTRSWLAAHQRLVGVAVGGVGVVGIGVGSAFGLQAKAQYDRSAAHCAANRCDAEGHGFRQSAFSKAELSNIAFGIGAAALVGGALLWFSAPKSTPSEAPHALLITPLFGPSLALLSVQRNW